MRTGKLLLQASCIVLGLSAPAQADHYKLRDIVVAMVLQEAAYEPFAGMVAVAGVALDRAADPRWPNSRFGVVLQRAQFTGMGMPFGHFSRQQVIKARIAVAQAEIGSRPCGRVLWYHADYVSPSWSKSKRLTVACKIGYHIFYQDTF